MNPKSLTREAIVLLSWMLALPVCGAQSSRALAKINPVPLTAVELLDKFAASQEALKSFIATYEETAQTDYPNAAPPIKGGSTTLGEVRVDFPRVAERSRNWGVFGGTKAQPQYSSRISDGHWALLYGQQSDAGGAMVMPQSQPRTDITCAAEAINGSVLREFLGVLQAGGKPRFDRKIRGEPTLRVRDRLDPAGWTPSPCYVIEAKTQTADYTVWLDPNCGYTLARALHERHFGHMRPNGQPYQKGESDARTIEKVRWEQRQSVWVPVEATGGHTTTEPGKPAWRLTWHFKLTRFDLDPDHTALRSFMPDDIRDGAKFTLVGEDRQTKGEGTWQKGRAVDAKGNVLWMPESLGGMATNKPPDSGQTGAADKPTSAGKK